MLKATPWLSGGAQIPTQAQPLSPNLVLILASPQATSWPFREHQGRPSLEAAGAPDTER